MKKEFNVFKMTSSYYLCEVDSTVKDQRLDPYEEDLGFQPAWVDIDTAIQTNNAVLSSETKRPPQWTAREIFMLKHIREHVLNSSQLTAFPTAETPPPAPHVPARSP